MKSFSCISVLLILLFTSCERVELDIKPPTLKYLELAPDPFTDMICGTMEDSVFHLRSGESLDFVVLLEDDFALSHFKTDIHNNFDCHGHGGSSTPGFSIPNIENQTQDWTILKTEDVSGQEMTLTKSLEVPDNVTPGRYHFHLQVLDESGNDSPFTNFYSLVVLNTTDTVPPSIKSELPATSFSVKKGENVRFVGSVEDDLSLSEGGNGVMFLSYTDESSGNTFISDQVFPFDSSITTLFNYDFFFTIPATIPSGDYTFTLRAHDGIRNIANPINFSASVSN